VQAAKGERWRTHLRPHHHMLTVIKERADPSLVTQDGVGDKQCLMTVDTRVYVTSSGPTSPLDDAKDN
jgi:hypothetical protein